MDNRLLAAMVSSIICNVLLLLTNYQHTWPSPSSSSTSSLWPLLMEIFQSSQAMAAALILEQDPNPRPRSPKRRRLMPPSPQPQFNGIMDSSSFKATFKVSQSTFEWLCTQMVPLLGNNPHVGVSLLQQIEMGLFRLATGSSYDLVSKRFGSTESMARLCTKRLCRALCTHFRSWVSYPASSAFQQVSQGFETLSGLPNCCGAIDCTRFKFTMGPGANDDLQQSVVTQIVVDSSSRILNILTGHNGDKGDSRVLRSSTLYSDVENGHMLNSNALCVHGVSVPQYLVGDCGYPLLPWLMVPYTEPVPQSCQEDFNSKHYLLRQSALRALACLRRWGILSKDIEEEDLRVGVACIGACAILHNVLLSREDEDGVLEGIDDYALHDESSQYYRDASKEECLIEKKASLIRNVLALMARDSQISGHGGNN